MLFWSWLQSKGKRCSHLSCHTLAQGKQTGLPLTGSVPAADGHQLGNSRVFFFKQFTSATRKMNWRIRHYDGMDGSAAVIAMHWYGNEAGGSSHTTSKWSDQTEEKNPHIYAHICAYEASSSNTRHGDSSWNHAGSSPALIFQLWISAEAKTTPQSVITDRAVRRSKK